ncbi:Endo-1,4-beta-xylanase A precursor [Pelotomaculum sp. FP]|uniref:S-layer homology domain-containing protein n=1 Tax=Pelotomaculum sp. FP TaxID=261474 RepID=UPI0010647E28|nr:S-layer homology domain-containing protein [Pelotomaculum sp. FP]TEB16746.1 Endo-1,4-beta-xylanase A precursor [Pelotomaculum sp. FP]
MKNRTARRLVYLLLAFGLAFALLPLSAPAENAAPPQTDASVTGAAYSSAGTLTVPNAVYLNSGIWTVTVQTNSADADGGVPVLEPEFSYGAVYMENGFDEANKLTPAVSSGENGCTVYTLSVPAQTGVLFYKASTLWEGNQVPAGGGAIPVTADGQAATLAVFLLNLWNSMPVSNGEVGISDVATTMTDGQGWAYQCYVYQNPDNIPNNRFIYTLPAYGNDNLYSYDVTVSKDGYLGFGNNAMAVFLGGYHSDDIRICPSTSLTLKVPKGATTVLQRKTRHYIPFIPAKLLASDTSDPDYDRYTYECPVGGNIGNYHYRISKPGYVTKAACLSSAISEPTTITFHLEAAPAERVTYLESNYRSPNGYEDNLLTNAPDSAFINLAASETFKIKPLRAWQICNNEVDNYFIEPDFHYSVVSGASVTVDENGLVQAVGDGVSLVRITYDPIEVNGVYFNGIDPINTGLIVVNAGGGAAGFNTGIDLREYDTVYINGGVNYPDGAAAPAQETAQYTFTPEAGASVRVLAPPSNPVGCADWGFTNSGQWTSYAADSGGAFTVNLHEGRNIIEVAKGGQVQYHVVRARKLAINIANKTNPGKALLAGDTADITFRGVSMPVPKLAAIYNPGFSSDSDPTVGIRYDMNGDLVRSRGTQYYMTTYNDIVVKMDEEGDYNFTGGCIGLSWFGSPLGAHRNISEAGLLPNFNAPDNALKTFSRLPDFTIRVKSNEERAEQERLEFGKLTKIVTTGLSSQSYPDGFPQNHAYKPSATGNAPLKIKGIEYGGIIYGYNEYDVAQTEGLPDDFDLYWRYWAEGSKDNAVTEKVTEFPVQAGSFTVANNNSSTLDIINGELIIVAKDGTEGYPRTYTSIMSSSATTPYFTKLDDIELSFAGGTDSFSLTDGLLQAEPVTLENGTMNLGYGFLYTETDYTVTVPYGTENISLTPVAFPNMAEYVLPYVKVSVNDQYLETVYSPGRGANVQPNSKATAANMKGPDKALPATQEIALAAGETITIQLQVINQGLFYEAADGVGQQKFAPATYTIKATRAAAPTDVTFNLPENTSVIVKKATGKTMTAAAGKANLYQLPQGSYTYTVSGGGYAAKTFNLVVDGTEALTVTVKAEDLNEAAGQTGKVTVNVVSYDKVLVGNASIPIAAEPADLTAYRAADAAPIRCVEYNVGGYTALHAILDAFASGQTTRIDFDCRRGDLTPRAGIDNSSHGANADWLCTVNGITVDPSTTVLKGGDRVDFFYYSDQGETTQAWFTDGSKSVSRSGSVTLTLMSAPLNNKDAAGVAPCANADILVNGQKKAATDAEGQVTLNGADLSESNSITAFKDNGSGKNLLTFTRCVVTVTTGSVTPPSDADSITVSFRLIGDSCHGDAGAHVKYVTWIATRQVTVNKGATVYDVFTKALNEAGLQYVGAESNYVSSIEAPAAYGGYWLSEFSNGPNSGWMYTVNGIHPNVGLEYYTLSQGDKIIWHYVDDYKVEAPWNGTPSYKWLEAEDVNPPSGGTVIDMSGSGKVEKPALEEPEGSLNGVTVAAVLDQNSVAVATLAADTLDAFNKAITAGEDAKGAVVVVTVEIPAGATAMKLTIPQTAVAALGQTGNTSLSIATGLGNLTFDAKAVAVISASAVSEGFTVSIVQANTGALNEEAKALIGNRPVYDFSVTAGDNLIASFGGGSVSISIPYALQPGEDQNAVVVYRIDDAGNLQTIRGAYHAETGTVNFAVTHFSKYAVGYNKITFTDIDGAAWYHGAVTFCAARGIAVGIGGNMFGPENTLTRGQFIVMLMRAYGIEPDENPTNNFADAGDTYYTNYLAVAKRLGISTGVGDNMYAPDREISRQDVFTLLYRTLDLLGELPETTAGKTLTSYTDAGKISDYAKTAMENFVASGTVTGSDGKLDPGGNTTRAQMAQVLYNLLAR